MFIPSASFTFFHSKELKVNFSTSRVLLSDLLTAAQVFLRRYTALDCRAERMALREEKFFSCLHSWRDTGRRVVTLADQKKFICFSEIFLNPDLCNGDPPFDDACSVGGAGACAAGWARGSGREQEGRGGDRWWDGRGSCRAGRGGTEQRGDDTVGDGVELGDGGADGGRQVSVFFLVTLRPNAAQAVKGHHSDKQLLRERDTILTHRATRWCGENELHTFDWRNLQRPVWSAALLLLSQDSPWNWTCLPP